jgi:hypothetical protein
MTNALAPDAHALVQGLSEKPPYNGKLVICKRFLDKKQRWHITFPGGEAAHMAAKSENLKPLERHTFVYKPRQGRLSGLTMPMYCTFDRCGTA